MKIKPFSVAMCVYQKDDRDHFTRGIDSILHQTVKPSEVVLVVDGPVPDKLREVIERYDQKGVKIIWLSENRGHGNARRIGIQSCTHDLIALMDADDISLPDRFEKQLSIFAADEKIDIVGGNIAEFIGTPDKIIGLRKVPSKDADIKMYLKKRCPMNQMTVMLKKTSVQHAGGYIDWFCNEDYYLWIRMAQHGMIFANSSDVLVYARVGEDMYARRGGWKYYRSEARLQRYMLKNWIIRPPTYLINCGKRFIVQVMMSNWLRGWVYKKIARKST